MQRLMKFLAFTTESYKEAGWFYNTASSGLSTISAAGLTTRLNLAAQTVNSA